MTLSDLDRRVRYLSPWWAEGMVDDFYALHRLWAEVANGGVKVNRLTLPTSEDLTINVKEGGVAHRSLTRRAATKMREIDLEPTLKSRTYEGGLADLISTDRSTVVEAGYTRIEKVVLTMKAGTTMWRIPFDSKYIIEFRPTGRWGLSEDEVERLLPSLLQLEERDTVTKLLRKCPTYRSAWRLWAAYPSSFTPRFLSFSAAPLPKEALKINTMEFRSGD